MKIVLCMYWRCLFLFFGFVGSNLFCFLLSIWVGIGFASLAHPWLGLLGKKSANTWQCLWLILFYTSSAVVFLLGSGLASLCSLIPVWGEKWNVKAENWICCVSCCLRIVFVSKEELASLCSPIPGWGSLARNQQTPGGVCDWFCFMCLCRSFFSGGIGFASLAHPWLGFLGKKQERCRIFLVLFSVCFEVGIGFASLAHPF